MALGLPVVCSNIPLHAEIVELNRAGLSVNPESTEDIVSAITNIFHSPALANEYGTNGQRAVQNKYSWHLQEVKLHKFFEQISRHVIKRNYLKQVICSLAKRLCNISSVNS